MFTVAGAYANFEETLKGRIKRGMLADFTLLADDPREVDPMSLSELLVSATIIGGEIVFEA